MSAMPAAANDDEELEATPAAYEFDLEFQRKIVALAFRDTGFLQKTEGLIEPGYFEQDVDGALAKIALDFYATYKKAPDRAIVGTLIKTELVAGKIRKDLLDEIKDAIKEVYTTDVSDRDFVADQVGAFARDRAVENALVESIGYKEKGQFDKIKEVMQKALLVGTRVAGNSYDYAGEIDNRTSYRVDVAAGLIKREGISSGIPELDAELYHGGWGRKEMVLFLGAAKAGKSMSLGEFAKNAWLDGYNTLYVTLEVAARIISDRLDANLSDTLMKGLKDTPHAVAAKVKAHAAKTKAVFKIDEFASGSLKISMLRRLIEDYRAQGIMFDVIVVDYGDIMAPERFTGDLREDLRLIFLELRAIAFDYNCAMLTATQSNRDGAKAMTVKATDVAEDYNKIRTADLVISINALEEEVKSGEARLFFAAARNGETGQTLRIKQDRSRMQFLKKVLAKE